MKLIEILKISSPSNFWIAEKNSGKFIDLISDFIKQEQKNGTIENENYLNDGDIISFYDLSTDRYYRARILEQVTSFRSNCFSLFMIDLAQRITVPKNCCQPILNENLKRLAPLARKCSLYGISPIQDEWSPASIRFLSEIKKNTNQIYAEYIDKGSESSIRKVKLYIHLNQQDTNEYFLINLNDLLVENKFALWLNKIELNQQTAFKELVMKNGLKFQYQQSLKRLDIEPKIHQTNFNNLDYIKSTIKNSLKIPSKNTIIEQIKQNNSQEEEDKLNSTIKSEASTVYDQEKLDSEFSNLLNLNKYIIKNSADSKLQNADLYSTMDPYILLHNTPVIPIQSTKEQRIHPSVRDFLSFQGILSVSNLNSYLWPCILHGMHCFFMPDESKSSPITFLAPLMSLLLEKSTQQIKKKFESGFVKKSIAQSQCENGPILLIVCASSENAQKIYEIIDQVIQMDSRLNGRDKIRALMIQGGGHENQYDVPLANGIDILIASTPFCLLKAIGEAKTNLERIRYLVFDQAYLLLEKFPLQIKTLMEVYTNLIEISDSPYRAQFILISHFWSTKLKKFIEKFLIKPAFIIGNKLEASFYGQTHHVLKDIESEGKNKGIYIKELIESNKNKNVLICANTFERTMKLYDYLFKKCNFQVDCVTHESRSPKIRLLEEKWNKRQNQGLLMVIQQQMLEQINLDKVKCVINYDFPLTKTAFALRLWTMRGYFMEKKEFTEVINEYTKNDESFKIELNNDYHLVEKEPKRLCSYIMLSKSTSPFADSLFNFLTRIGYKKNDFPSGFVKMVEECRLEKDELKLNHLLCPYIKTFGSCMNPNPNSCKYRHRPNKKADKVEYLDKDLKIPTQGYVKFKISFVKDTNHFFANILSYKNLNDDNEVPCDRFKELDLSIQLYFSDTNNIKFMSKFKQDELYAFKDTSSSVFKRIKIEDIIRKDGKIAFELIVKCIDYGSKLHISSQDLIKLPDQFKTLPPQAVEIYLCDVRPIEKDLAWSVQSRVFMSEKLQKHKEFIGKIQLAAGCTLWLHPITSYKHLKNLDLLVREDSIHSELVENNYGVKYAAHLNKLRSLFLENGLFVPTVEDNLTKIKNDSNLFYELFYDLENCKEEEFKPDFSFLNKNFYTENLVYLSSIQESMKKMYIQSKKFYDNLLSLNEDIEKYIEKILKFKDSSIIKNRKKESDLDELTANIDIEEDKTSNDLLFWKRTVSIRQNINSKVVSYLKSICKSLYCIVSNKTEYNRAEILEITDDGKVKVFFVDFGDVGTVSVDEIFPISPKFIRLLPFQAIECSNNGIIPLISDQNNNHDGWSKESIDFFVSLTRDREDKFFDLFAEVLDTYDSFKYSIKLLRKAYPENVDLSFEMVANGHAKLESAYETKLFCNRDSIDNQLSQLAKQFFNFFIKNTEIEKQKRFLEVLNCKSAIVQIMNQDEIVKSGLLQCLSQSLYFISDTKNKLLILMFVRKIILMKKDDNCELVQIFINHKGAAKLFNEIANNEEEMANFSFNFLTELISISFEFKRFLINNLNYLTSVLDLIHIFKNEETKIEKCLDLIHTLIETFDDETKFDSNTIDYFFNLIKSVELSDNLEKKINIIFEKFSNREILNENDRLSDSPNQSEINDEAEEYQTKHVSNEDFNNENSSDEITEEFETALMNLIFNNRKTPNTEHANIQVSNWLPKKEYIYPKCSWNQDSEFVYLKVLLKNVKDCELNFGSAMLSFRCTIDEKKYGLDFELFSEIDQLVESSSEIGGYFRIKMKKKYSGIWTRLLSSVIKPSFIKSEYNNLDDSSESDTEKRKKFKEYLSSQPCKELVKFIPESPVVSDSDSDSDFDDHDTDMKELKDYRWE